MSEHQCQCRECKPSAYPQGERMNENHYAVRLGDAPKPLKVFLDGVDVTKDTTECIAGDEGHVWMIEWVSLETYTSHQCACGGGVCEAERIGKVEVVMNAATLGGSGGVLGPQKEIEKVVEDAVVRTLTNARRSGRIEFHS